jgi:hypothetical protein
MSIKTRICNSCGEKKELKANYDRSHNYYYRRACKICYRKERNRINQQKAREARKAREEKAKRKIYKKQKLDGSIQLYYDYFFKNIDNGVKEDEAINLIKDKFSLKKKYALSLKNQFLGIENPSILDYSKL